MKKYIYRYSTLVGVLVCLTTSCKKDFLNQLPETSTTGANVYKTSNDFYNAVVGAYSTFKSNGLYGTCNASSALLNLSEVAADNSEYGAPRTTAGVDIYELEDFTFSLGNGNFSNAWLDHYKGIGRVNTILDKLAGVNFDAALKTRFEAESKFLRAVFYFNLVRLFGDVPLATTEFTDPNDGNTLSRTPAADVYKLIVSDLTFAENNLPASIPASEAGRASKWAAKALLGKVYLTNKNYTDAATKLNEVITSGLFNVNADTYPAVFSASTAYASNKDVIFAVQYLGGQIKQGSSISSSTLPWSVSTGLFGITGGGTGDGFLRPTAEFITDYEPGDLRKAASVATSYVNGSNTVNERFVVKYQQPGSLVNDSDVDFPVLRYADVLLMYAEALNEQGQSMQALAASAAGGPVNLIRKRAGLPDLSAALTQPNARLAIEHERRMELAFEGQRWFDLVRTGRFQQIMNAKGYATKAFNILYPVPIRETGINPNLGQNPGY